MVEHRKILVVQISELIRETLLSQEDGWQLFRDLSTRLPPRYKRRSPDVKVGGDGRMHMSPEGLSNPGVAEAYLAFSNKNEGTLQPGQLVEIVGKLYIAENRDWVEETNNREYDNIAKLCNLYYEAIIP